MLLRVQELRKSYDGAVAVDGLSFEVRRGETFGLLGPNGAGKSTTITMLVGALRPDSGTIEIAGSRDPGRPETRARVGIAPQQNSLYDALTATENLRFFGTLYGLRGAALDAAVAAALEFAGLAGRAGDRVETYSGGMKRRLNLVCAVLHDPDIILLDEPTVGVDPQSRHHIFDHIRLLQGRGKTVLLTTHHMEEAERLCDRIAIMDRGRLLALDTLEALVAVHGGHTVLEVFTPDAVGADWPFAADWAEGRLVRHTADPHRDIQRLAGAGVNFESLHIQRPNLEIVFLELTGRSLRDA